MEGTRQDGSVDDLVTPKLLVIAEDEFRAIVRAVAEELRRERDQARQKPEQV